MRRKTFSEMARSREEEMELEQHHARTSKEPGFWGAQGAGALFMARDTGRILFSFRSPHVNEGHTWGTFGGAIDPGETPAAAAKREAEEEAGYNAKANDIIPLFVFRSGNFRYHNFVILVPHEFEPSPYEGPNAYFSDPPGNWESESFVWTPFGEWPRPLHFGAASLLRDRKSLATLKRLALKFSANRH